MGDLLETRNLAKYYVVGELEYSRFVLWEVLREDNKQSKKQKEREKKAYHSGYSLERVNFSLSDLRDVPEVNIRKKEACKRSSDEVIVEPGANVEAMENDTLLLVRD